MNYKIIIIKIIKKNICDLFPSIFGVFHKMEMEINFINYKIFTEVYLKIKVRGRKISYHFLVEGKPRERIDLLITSSLNI